MSLFYTPYITVSGGAKKVGLVEINRATHLDVPTPDPDVECRYTVRVDGLLQGHVHHRYGDSPWVLLWKAAELITETEAIA